MVDLPPRSQDTDAGSGGRTRHWISPEQTFWPFVPDRCFSPSGQVAGIWNQRDTDCTPVPTSSCRGPVSSRTNIEQIDRWSEFLNLSLPLSLVLQRPNPRIASQPGRLDSIINSYNSTQAFKSRSFAIIWTYSLGFCLEDVRLDVKIFAHPTSHFLGTISKNYEASQSLDSVTTWKIRYPAMSSK